MKSLVHSAYSNETHRVFPEKNKELGYPYFCPQCDENFYDFEVFFQDYPDVEFYKIDSSNGVLYTDLYGNVLRQDTNDKCAKVVWFDFEEYEDFWGEEPKRELDILDLRGILADGRELIWKHYREQAKGR